MLRQTAGMETREAPFGAVLRGVSINVRGVALLETAVTLPIIFMIGVGIFEFGRAYQTWQTLTNAAREGARVAVTSSTTDLEVETAVRSYMAAERLGNAGTVPIAVNRKVAVGPNTATEVTIQYPFSFILLDPAVRFVRPASTTGAPLTMSAVAIMRNES
jgi:Flp pilus assembly protein TadG